MSNTPALDSQSLRRTQSTGDIPTVTQPARARISASHHRSAQRALETAPSSPANNAELAEYVAFGSSLLSIAHAPQDRLLGSRRPAIPLAQPIQNLPSGPRGQSSRG